MKNIVSYLSFKIGNENYAANVGYVHNIIEYCEITEVSEMPKHMLGIINLRGQVLPVVDSRLKFGIERTEITTNTCIVIMEVSFEKKNVFVGILVDSVTAVIDIKKKEIKKLIQRLF